MPYGEKWYGQQENRVRKTASVGRSGDLKIRHWLGNK